MTTFIALLAGIGIGSIISAFIGWIVAVSNHRQAWINALRDDIATFIKELGVMHEAIRDQLRGDELDGALSRDLEKKKQEARATIQLVYWRITLRLNRTEQMHIDLRQRLDHLLAFTYQLPGPENIESAVDLARQVLKREWEVTKYGPATWFVMWVKGLCPSN